MFLLRTNQKGAALITTLFFLVIVTVLAAASLMLATVQIKVSSAVARSEMAFHANEGQINFIMPLIKTLHFDSTIPNDYCAFLTTPCPMGLETPKLADKLAFSDNYNEDPDVEVPSGDPLTSASLAWYETKVSMNRVGVAQMAGGGIESSWGYHGSVYGGGSIVAYTVKATSTNPSSHESSRSTQVLWLRVTM
jgi:Tfp pilus assembly protein PilX